MKKKSLFRAVVVLALCLMMVIGVTVTASAEGTTETIGAVTDTTVLVSGATITSSEENGKTNYYLNINIKNNAEEVVDGKTVGLKTLAAVQITKIDGDVFGFSSDTNAIQTREYISAYDTATLIFNIIPKEGADLTKEIAFEYTIYYSSVPTKEIAGEQQTEVKKIAGTAKINEQATETGTIINFLKQTGFYRLFAEIGTYYPNLIMILISFVLMYLAIVKKFEPLLLLPIAFGVLLTNLPAAEMYHEFLFAGGHVNWDAFSANAGLLDYLYLGVKLGIYPCLIFIGVGAMTDFGPLIARPKSLLLGAAAQLGIFATFVVARLADFTSAQASSIGIIGGADGPTAIFVTSKLAPELLGPIAIAAYSYMALVPVIQPPIMRLLTTKKEREIEMKTPRAVSKTEKIIFPIIVTVFVALLVPSAAPLIGCLMLGNLMRESGVVDRLVKTVQNELMNIVTIFLGVSVGATATASTFLTVKTLIIIIVGVCAFALGSAGGVLFAKLMNLFSKEKINPLIGSAGVSAVPMAARVSQVEGQKAKPGNYLLMHAMGPNVAGVIGSAIAAGVLLALFGM